MEAFTRGGHTVAAGFPTHSARAGCRFRLTITGIIGSLTQLDFDGPKPLDGERFGLLELANRRSWYVVVSGAAMELRIERTEGTVGASQSAAGPCFSAGPWSGL